MWKPCSNYRAHQHTLYLLATWRVTLANKRVFKLSVHMSDQTFIETRTIHNICAHASKLSTYDFLWQLNLVCFSRSRAGGEHKLCQTPRFCAEATQQTSGSRMNCSLENWGVVNTWFWDHVGSFGTSWPTFKTLVIIWRHICCHLLLGRATFGFRRWLPSDIVKCYIIYMVSHGSLFCYSKNDFWLI